jgi:hypothetical protein
MTEATIIQPLKEKLKSPASVADDERYHAILNYREKKSDYFLECLIVALGDPVRKIRRLALNYLEMYGPQISDQIIGYFAEYSRYKKGYLALVFGRWFKEYKHLKWYEIIRELPVQQRQPCVEQLINRLLSESNFNNLFEAKNSLELIGDFRAIPVLKHTSIVLKSQIQKRYDRHDEYSTFLLVLRFFQFPSDLDLKYELLKNHLFDILKIVKKYNGHDIFSHIFNSLGLLGQIIEELYDKTLDDAIQKTFEYSRGSWAYITLIWVLTAYYPKSVRELENLRLREKKSEGIERIDEIIEDISGNFKVKLKSGYSLFL